MQDPNSGTPWPHTNLYLDLWTSLDTPVLQTLPLNIYLTAPDLEYRITSNQVGTWPAPNAAPNITSISPSPAAVGSLVTITGSNFGLAQGSSTLTFNGVTATVSSWSSNSIVVIVPAGATTGSVVITIAGFGSAANNFTVLPNITSLSPNSGSAGTSVTVTGNNFGAGGAVTFNQISATVMSWSANSIVVAVPASATTGSVVVTVGAASSNGMNFVVGRRRRVLVQRRVESSKNNHDPTHAGIGRAGEFPRAHFASQRS